MVHYWLKVTSAVLLLLYRRIRTFKLAGGTTNLVVKLLLVQLELKLTL